MTLIAPHIAAFLQQRLPVERRASPNTCDSYAHAFKLLFQYASECLKVRPSELNLEHIDAPLVVKFLGHLETTRGNCAGSRNIRLAAIKSFMHFMEYRVPSALEQIQRILGGIALKKRTTPSDRASGVRARAEVVRSWDRTGEHTAHPIARAARARSSPAVRRSTRLRLRRSRPDARCARRTGNSGTAPAAAATTWASLRQTWRPPAAWWCRGCACRPALLPTIEIGLGFVQTFETEPHPTSQFLQAGLERPHSGRSPRPLQIRTRVRFNSP